MGLTCFFTKRPSKQTFETQAFTTMQKQIFFIIILFFHYNFAIAQEWSKEDSIWLQNVMEGKEVLKINEDVIKAIEDGRFITPSLFMKDKNRYIDLIKDFEDIETPDKMNKIDPYSMPPAVFSLYVLKMPSIDKEFRFELTDKEKGQLKVPLPTNLSKMIRPFNTDPLHTYGGGNLLSGVSSLLKLINRRQPELKKEKPIPMSESERRRLIQLINDLRLSIKTSAEQE
jgi:hypothetical protein